MDWIKTERGQAAQLGDIAIGAFIALFVVVTLYNALPTTSFTAEANTALASIFTNVLTGFTLVGVLLIIIAAMAIRGASR